MSKQTDIFKNRAEKLAKVIKTQDLARRETEVLVFNLGQEKYAVEIKFVKEVYPLKDYTPLPDVPPFIFGMVNVRRKVLSIFDLKVFFGLPSREESRVKKLIILEYGEMELALLTDEIHSIQKIPIQDIQPSLPTLTGTRQDFLKGIIPERIMFLNTEKLLTSQHIIVNENTEI